jgi:lactate dehydrogenase-like 2-hydroxyacid dehydrogenase
MKNSIYITRPIPSHAIDTLKASGFEVVVRQNKKAPTKKEIIKELKKHPYSALVSFLTDTIDDEVFTSCPTLRIVVNYAVGFDNIDINSARKRGITVANTAGTSGAAVAEFTVALMISLLVRVVEGDRFIRAKKYKGWNPYLLLGSDIGGKTVGLIGAGDIGSRVAKMMIKGFDCKVIYFDMKNNEALDSMGAQYLSQEEVLKQADIISLHVPLLPTTVHLINKNTLNLMKPSAVLINTSRGPVVDEKALTDALISGRIAGAGLDVFEFEPKISKTLRKLQNVILTPHIASARVSVRESMAAKVAENLQTFFSGGEIKNLTK